MRHSDESEARMGREWDGDGIGIGVEGTKKGRGRLWEMGDVGKGRGEREGIPVA